MNKSAVALVAAFAALPIFAEIKMGAPFTDGAVLQRGMKVPVWGKATPPAGKTARSVKVEFAGQSKTAEIGEGGAWKVMLDPMDASKESRTMKVAVLESDESVEVKDILVGEVWFASGQSNMVSEWRFTHKTVCSLNFSLFIF